MSRAAHPLIRAGLRFAGGHPQRGRTSYATRPTVSRPLALVARLEHDLVAGFETEIRAQFRRNDHPAAATDTAIRGDRAGIQVPAPQETAIRTESAGH